MYLIGYNIGSSSIKASLVDAQTQEVISTVWFPDGNMKILSRQKAWAEQQPEIWWSHLCSCTKRLIKETGVNAKSIKAIGISYQMHGLVLVDKERNVLRPSIIWCDSRSAPIGRQAFSDIGVNYCLNNYLNSPGNFTASKLKWVKDNEPELYGRTYKILLPGEYITMRLTGEMKTSYSGLSEGIFWNFKTKKIAKKVLDYYEFDTGILPDISGTFECIGEVSTTAARATGLPKGIPVSYRAGDQPNNALSLNVLRKGEVAATSASSGVVYGIVEHLMYDLQSRINAFAHVNYEENFNKIGILLCINGAGMQYAWMKNQVALAGRSYFDMERMISSIPVGSEGVCVLPFGNGAERMFNNQNLESHIYNLEFNRHTRAHLYRASIEGVAFSFVYGINLLKEMGLKVNTIRVANDNMFQSKVFSETVATLLGTRIEVMNTNGAIGAAKASGVGIGLYNSVEEAVQANSFVNIFEPTLNYANCSQAYDYWINNLNRILDKGRSAQNSESIVKSEYFTLKRDNELKNIQLETQSLEIADKNETLGELKELLDNASNEKNIAALSEMVRQAKVLLTKHDRSFTNSNSFETHFELLNNSFVQNFRKEFPQFSYDELRLAYFLKMKLSTKEISDRLGISIRGVETKRYRLRKKLNLDRSQKLTSYFDKFD